MELHQGIHCTYNSESTLDDKIDPLLVRSVKKKSYQSMCVMGTVAHHR